MIDSGQDSTEVLRTQKYSLYYVVLEGVAWKKIAVQASNAPPAELTSSY